MEINIYGGTGARLYTITVDSVETTSVDELRGRVAAEAHKSVEQIVLLFAGRKLEDGHTLSICRHPSRRASRSREPRSSG